MARKKKTNTPKNNFYWIYASIIFLIISLSFVGGDKGLQNVQQSDISSFEDFLSLTLKNNMPSTKIIGSEI